MVIFISYPLSAQTNSLQGLFGRGTSLDFNKVDIKSNTSSIRNTKGVGSWSGDVRATTSDGTTLMCDKLEIFYHYEKTDEKKPVGDKVVATGNVRIDKPGNENAAAISATAERLEYNKADEMVILTGDPILKQGESILKASKITYDVKEDDLSCENVKMDFVPEKR